MGPALDQDGPVRVGAVDLEALARRDSELGRSSFRPSCWLSKSSITRSASRYSRELATTRSGKGSYRLRA